MVSLANAGHFDHARYPGHRRHPWRRAERQHAARDCSRARERDRRGHRLRLGACGAGWRVPCRRSPRSGRPGKPRAGPSLRCRRAKPCSGSPKTFRSPRTGCPMGPASTKPASFRNSLIRVATARGRDVLWAMEEALRCRAVGVVIGELRASSIDQVATRRLSLAAVAGNTLGLILRTAPDENAFPRGDALDHRHGARSLVFLRQNRRKVGRRAAAPEPPSSCAIAVAISEPGSWSGTVWSSVSSSQRILSLWLERFSTDRIARQSA